MTLTARSIFGLGKRSPNTVTATFHLTIAVPSSRLSLRPAASTAIVGELLRVLCILADIKTTQFFSNIGDKDYSHEAFRWRRGEFFWHIRAKVSLATFAW